MIIHPRQNYLGSGQLEYQSLLLDVNKSVDAQKRIHFIQLENQSLDSSIENKMSVKVKNWKSLFRQLFFH